MKGKTLTGIGRKLSDKQRSDKQTLDLLSKLPKKLVVGENTYSLAIMFHEGTVWANYFGDGESTLTMDVEPSKTLNEALKEIHRYLRVEVFGNEKKA